MRPPDCPHTATSPSSSRTYNDSEHWSCEWHDVEAGADVLELQTCHCEVIDLAEVRDTTGAARQGFAEQVRCSGPLEALRLGHDLAMFEHAGLVNQEVGHELQPVRVV